MLALTTVFALVEGAQKLLASVKAGQTAVVDAGGAAMSASDVAAAVAAFHVEHARVSGEIAGRIESRHDGD